MKVYCFFWTSEHQVSWNKKNGRVGQNSEWNGMVGSKHLHAGMVAVLAIILTLISLSLLMPTSTHRCLDSCRIENGTLPNWERLPTLTTHISSTQQRIHHKTTQLVAHVFQSYAAEQQRLYFRLLEACKRKERLNFLVPGWNPTQWTKQRGL